MTEDFSQEPPADPFAQWYEEQEEQEREGVRLDIDTIGYAWVFALIPLGLLTILATALLGARAWYLFVAGFLAIAAFLAWLPNRQRYIGALPLMLDDGTLLRGSAKRRHLLRAFLIGTALFVGERMHSLYGHKLLEWTI